MATRYAEYFPAYVKTGIAAELLDPELARFDLARLAAALKPERDLQFQFLGLQTLYDRYFLHVRGKRIELPQAFFMRVAMGLAVREIDREARAIEFYDLLSSFDFMASTPTLFNSGTLRPQLSSCFLTTVADDLDGIFKSVKDNALLAKYSGGLGNDWTPVRGLGAHIKGTNGESQGIIPFLKVANDTAIAVNQGGKRKGAVCAYLETWHVDIEEFLDLRKNTGDDRRRTHDMNTANWVPDLFMQRVEDDGEWTLFSPDETPDLHDLYGAAFKAAYEAYEAKAEARRACASSRRVRATDLWRRMLTMLFETGHPWITFKDPCNLRSPQRHVGVVHSSNLCTEITLNTSADEVAVCNLGSVNLLNHVGRRRSRPGQAGADGDDGGADARQRHRHQLLHDPGGAPLQPAPSAGRPRPDGLSGCAAAPAHSDCLATRRSPSPTSAWRRSPTTRSRPRCDLAAERGRYPSFEGSLWSKGILPIDSLELRRRGARRARRSTARRRSTGIACASGSRPTGMRNSNVMAIAPTATISNICGVSQSIEPTYQNLFVKSNMSGDFTVVNAVPRARPQGARALGRGDGLRPQIFRRQRRPDRPRPGRSQGALRDRLRDRQRLADRGGRAPAEMDRPGAVAQPLHRQSLRQEARCALSARLAARAEDHLLPALALGDPCREIDAEGHRRQAQRGVGIGAVSHAADHRSPTAAAPDLDGVKACRIDDPDCEACQ